MRIGIELKQEWATTKELLEYLRLLSRTMERMCEMEADTPSDWYFHVEDLTEGEHKIELTHL